MGATLANLTIEPGAIIDGYTLIKPLGEGGMANAWLAKNRLHQRYVLKILKWMHMKGPQKARFIREAMVIASLNERGGPGSERIVRVRNVSDEDAEVIYMVMDYIPGGDLQDKLAFEVPSRHEALRFFREILVGMRVAHERKLGGGEGESQIAPVVHRDIKPANILVDKDSNPVITDFGLAGFNLLSDGESVMEAAGHTREGVLAGTHGYMPPEQARLDLAKVDERGDIYSLGTLLMEILTGRRPTRDLRLDIKAGQAVLLEGVEEPLRGIIIRACSYDPDDRYQSVAAFIQAIDPILADTPATEPAWTPRPGVVRPAAAAPTPSPRPVTPDVVPIEVPRKQDNDREASPLYTEVYEPPAPRKWGRWIGGGLAIGAIVLVAIILTWPKGGTETVENPPAVETHVDAPVVPPPDPIPPPVEEVKPTVETPPVTTAPIVAIPPKPNVPVKVKAPKPPIDPNPKVVETPPVTSPPPVETPTVTEPKITIISPQAQAKVGEVVAIKAKVTLPSGSVVSRASLYWQGSSVGAWQSKAVTVNEGTIGTSIPASAGLGSSVQYYVAVWIGDVRKNGDKVTTNIVP